MCVCVCVCVCVYVCVVCGVAWCGVVWGCCGVVCGGVVVWWGRCRVLCGGVDCVGAIWGGVMWINGGFVSVGQGEGNQCNCPCMSVCL